MRIFRHYVPVSVLVLATTEVLIFIGATYAGLAARLDGPDLNRPTDLAVYPAFHKALVFTLVMTAAFFSFGLYQRQHHHVRWRYYAQCLASFATGAFLLVLVYYALPQLYPGPRAFALALLIALGGDILARGVFLRLAALDMFKKRILVLGTGSRAAKVASLEHANGHNHNFHVVAYLPDNGNVGEVDPSLILRNGSSLQSIVDQYQIDEIVVGIRDRRHGHMPMKELLERKLGGTNIIELSTFLERETGRVELETLNPSWLIFSDGFRNGALRSAIKRLFDIVVSGLLLLSALPVMVIIALLIWLESGRPITYTQPRIGVTGRPFNLLKFRSMRLDAEADGLPRWATQNDDRCTTIGRLIRKLRFDELPQLINVLKGEMSFVGPRPERPLFVQQLTKEIPYYSHRLAIKPGITGWAQIHYPYGASVRDAREKLQYDLYYVKNHSLMLDLVILAQTVHTVLFAEGAR
jgi:sugar transferase (PEP-CTERM system associated)